VTISGFNVNLRGKQKTGLVGMNLPLTGRLFTWGVSYQELFSFSLKGMYTGADMLLGVHSDTIDIAVRTRPTIELDNAIQINQANVHFVSRIIRPLPFDCVMHFYDGYARFKCDAEVDAVASYLGLLEEFNTDEHNSLSQSFDGTLRNSSWGAKVGTGWCFGNKKNKMLIHAAFEKSEPLKFQGTLHSVSHSFPASIDITDITATVKKEQDITDALTINLPSFLELKMVSFSNRSVISVGFRQYYSGLGFSYYGGSQDMEFNSAADFKFEAAGIHMGAGLINVVKPEPRALYYFSFGIVMSSNKNWQWDQLLVALPLQVLKTTISYKF
jgi:hypothetical protein